MVATTSEPSAGAVNALKAIGLEPADLTPEALSRVEVAVAELQGGGTDPEKLAAAVPRR